MSRKRAKTPKWQRPKPQTFSFHQDFALELCRAEFGTCPFGCVKNGAPNCDINVRMVVIPGYPPAQCEPGKRTQQRANEYEAWLREMEAAQVKREPTP